MVWMKFSVSLTLNPWIVFMVFHKKCFASGQNSHLAGVETHYSNSVLAIELHCWHIHLVFIAKYVTKNRGNYDHCRMLNTRHLSLLEQWGDNTKVEQKVFKKPQLHLYFQQKIVVWVSRLLRPNMAFLLGYLCSLKVLTQTIYVLIHNSFCQLFIKCQVKLWVKLGNQILQNMGPWVIAS